MYIFKVPYGHLHLDILRNIPIQFSQSFVLAVQMMENIVST